MAIKHVNNEEHPEGLEVQMTPEEEAAWTEQQNAAVAGGAGDLVGASVETIPADGVTSSIVTAYAAALPANITFNANGQEVIVPATDGFAELEVTAAQPGPIEVTALGRSVVITAEGV